MNRWKLVALLGVPLLIAAASYSLPAPVADAAMRGDQASIQKLLKEGANVNAAQGDGMTALHWAAQRGDLKLTEALLAAHANVAATTRLGAYTPLHIAARDGDAAVVNALIKAGADVKAVTTTGATALHLAAEAGNPDVVQALLDKGADPNVRESEWGQTPLIFAAEYGRTAVIKVLLKHGADPSIHTKQVDIMKSEAELQAATKKRNEVLISFEPEKHLHDTIPGAAAPAASAGRGRRGGAGAAGAHDSSAMGAKAAGAHDSSAMGAKAAGAHDSAAMGGDKADKKTAAADSSIPASGGAGPAAFGGPGGRRGGPQPKGPFTPDQIQAAIDSGRAVLMKSNLVTGPVTEKVDTLNGGVAGFAKTVGGVGGLSALHHAVRQGNLDAVVALLDGGANINDVSGVDHTTPLLLAAINGQFDVAMTLINRGADPNIASTTGMTPLYAVINSAYLPRTRFPQPEAVQSQKTGFLDVEEALLKKGANPNVRLISQPWYFAYNNCGNENCGLEHIDGTTPFWRAAYSLDVNAMKLLVKYGADPTIPSFKKPAPPRGGRGAAGAAAGLSDAYLRGRAAPVLPPWVDSASKAVPPGIGVYPIDAVAGVGYGNGFAGNSHRHAPDGWMPAMRYMVEVLHADVNQRDENGDTPLHNAAARGDNEMIKYLVAHGADIQAVDRKGYTVLDMANAPVQRLRPFPETIALLAKLGAKNTNRCVGC